jgi:hypothetical protein
MRLIWGVRVYDATFSGIRSHPMGGEFDELHCKPGGPVQIEPGLRSESPENGNYSMNAQRLSAFSAGSSGNRSLETACELQKPAIGGLFSDRLRPKPYRPQCLAGDAVLIEPVSRRIPC